MESPSHPISGKKRRHQREYFVTSQDKDSELIGTAAEKLSRKSAENETDDGTGDTSSESLSEKTELNGKVRIEAFIHINDI